MPSNNSELVIKEGNKVSTSAIVELYEIDFSIYPEIVKSLGYPVFRFTNSRNPSGEYFVAFNGKQYISIPCEVSGFEWSGQGVAPRPELKFSTIQYLTAGIIKSNNDFVGCRFTRLKTFANLLNREDMQIYSPDVFIIEQCSNLSDYQVSFAMKHVLDLQHINMVRRRAIKNYCDFKYRQWDKNKNTFKYDKFNPCPYVANNYFDINNKKISDASKDICNKNINGCYVRFSMAWNGNVGSDINQPLPLAAFPNLPLSK